MTSSSSAQEPGRQGERGPDLGHDQPAASSNRRPQRLAVLRVRAAAGAVQPIGNFFSGNPNSQQQVYILAQQKIQNAAQQSPLLAEAPKNTQEMLDGMLTSLGFQHVTVTFGGVQPG